MTDVLLLPVWIDAPGWIGALFGLAIGSFLNVCALRWPVDESVVSPPSRCPECGRPVRWFENIPVLGWIALRGRCRGCGTRISVQYPLVELATGAIWGGMLSVHGPGVDGLSGAVFLTILLGIAISDARFYIIPDEFSLGGAALGLLLALLPGGITPFAALAGAISGFALLWAVGWAGTRMFRRAVEEAGVDRALGGGDIKMMALIGAFTGPAGVLVTVFLGSALGALIFGPVSLVTKRLIPFGIFLAAGGAVAWQWGGDLVGWYRAVWLGLP